MPSGWPFIETERKFLVRSPSWRAQAARSIVIRQSYLDSIPGLTVRVRQIDDQFVLTFKTAAVGISRGEIEIPIGDACAAWLFSLCPCPAIEKERHLVVLGDVTWEIDVFHGRHLGLILAEIELAHPLQDVALPEWVSREVTDDPRYKNSHLYRQDGPPTTVGGDLTMSPGAGLDMPAQPVLTQV